MTDPRIEQLSEDEREHLAAALRHKATWERIVGKNTALAAACDSLAEIVESARSEE